MFALENETEEEFCAVAQWSLCFWFLSSCEKQLKLSGMFLDSLNQAFALRVSDRNICSRPQVEYNRQKMEVDARLRKAVIPNLQPDTSYDFKITSPEGNMGLLRHRIHAKTSPPILIRRPEVDHTREAEATVTIILPSLDTRSNVRCERTRSERTYESCMSHTCGNLPAAAL